MTPDYLRKGIMNPNAQIGIGPKVGPVNDAILNPSKYLGFKAGGQIPGGGIGNFTDKEQYKKEPAREFKGPGGPTDDEIETELPENGFVLNAETVKKYGADKLKQLIDACMPNGGGEHPTAKVKVSNGEMFVPPEAVASKGVEFWENLQESVTGQELWQGGSVKVQSDEEAKRAAIQQKLTDINSNRLADQKINSAIDTVNSQPPQVAAPIPQASSSFGDQYAQRRAEGQQKVAEFSNKIAALPGRIADDMATGAPAYYNDQVKPFAEKVNRFVNGVEQQYPAQTEQPSNTVIDQEKVKQLATPDVNNTQQAQVDNSKPKILYWTEQEFTNNGDPQKTAEIEARQANLGYERALKDIAVPEQTFQNEQRNGKTASSSTIHIGGYTPQGRAASNGLTADKAAELMQNKYQGVKDPVTGETDIVPVSGPVADQTFADRSADQVLSDLAAAEKAMQAKDATPQEKRAAQAIIAKYQKLFNK